MSENNGRPGPPTWHTLDRLGCVYGQRNSDRIKDLSDKMEEAIRELRASQAKVTWALVGFAISFGTAALLLLLNLLAASPIP